MSILQISTVKGMSTNYIKNIELTKRYEKHISKIHEITRHKSHIPQISEEQQKISQALKKSKQISKSFKQRQFDLKRQEENRRLMKSINIIHSGKSLRAQHNSDRSILKKRIKTVPKDDIMRQFQIQRENRKIANSIMTNVCDASKYKKRIQTEIAQYQKLRSHLQKLKPLDNGKDKPFYVMESKWSNPLIPKLKTLQSEHISNKQKNRSDVPTQHTKKTNKKQAKQI